MPTQRNPIHPQSNADKITACNVSLEFLKKQVKHLTEEQKEIREMLLKIMENTRPFEMVEAKKEESEPVKSWFWSS